MKVKISVILVVVVAFNSSKSQQHKELGMIPHNQTKGEQVMKRINEIGFLVVALLAFLINGCAPAVAIALTNTPPPPTSTVPPPTSTPTITLTPTKTPTPTATPNIVATQQYEDFIAMVQKIYDAGQISTLDGKYIKLDDYSDELAMSYGYRWIPTGVNAKSFIVRADFEWEVANQKNYSGCGYLFRQDPDPNYLGQYYYIVALDGLNGVLLSYISTDGHIPARLIQKRDMPDVGSNPYHAQFILVVTDTSAYTYVNENFLSEHKLQSNWLTVSGPLSYLVLTGSDKDFGTRCKITNAELWVIEP